MVVTSATIAHPPGNCLAQGGEVRRAASGLPRNRSSPTPREDGALQVEAAAAAANHGPPETWGWTPCWRRPHLRACAARTEKQGGPGRGGYPRTQKRKATQDGAGVRPGGQDKDPHLLCPRADPAWGSGVRREDTQGGGLTARPQEDSEVGTHASKTSHKEEEKHGPNRVWRVSRRAVASSPPGRCRGPSCRMRRLPTVRPGPWLLSDGLRGKGACTVPDVTPTSAGTRKQEREGDRPASSASWAVNILPVDQSPAPSRGAVSPPRPETREPPGPQTTLQGSFINPGRPRPRELGTRSQHPAARPAWGPGDGQAERTRGRPGAQSPCVRGGRRQHRRGCLPAAHGRLRN